MKTAQLHVVCLSVGMFLMIWLSGCDRKPDRVEVPTLDPVAIGKGAMEKYDTNGDGAVAGDELEAAGSLRDHPELVVKLIDRDGNGKVTAEEVQKRIEQWIEQKVGVLTFQCQVTLDGKPLEGATVKFVPEPFMGGSIHEATGVTDANGFAVLAADPKNLPNNLRGAFMQPGYYTVQITHPEKNIPAKYNSETTLGQEVASDLGSVNVKFELKSR